MNHTHELPIGTVAIVGPGRVGTVLASALERAGHTVASAAGGSAASRERFGHRFPRARRGDEPAAAVAGSDLVVVATPDDAIAGVVADLAVRDALHEGQRLLHVSGALGLAPLRPAVAAGARVAACHPAQTVPDAQAGPEALDGAAWAVTAATDDLAWARSFVTQVGGLPFDVPDDRRVLYHAGLVIGSNAVAAATAVARQLLRAASVGDPGPFLRPLVHASVDNVLAAGASAITGPIVRGDAGTVRAHLAALDRDAPLLAEAYRSLGRVVLAQVRIGMEPDQAASIGTALTEA